MKIEELRIGNTLNYNGVEVKVEVINNEIGEVYVWGDDFYYNVELENLKPIPLTEEWLLKFGFVESDKKRKRFIEEKEDFEIEIQGPYYAYCLRGGEFAPKLTQYIGHCKYVHQLQNLFFALTEKELCEAK